MRCVGGVGLWYKVVAMDAHPNKPRIVTATLGHPAAIKLWEASNWEGRS
jgi:hypothetical protein